MVQSADGRIVKDAESLTPDYLPEKLVGRQHVVGEIRRSLTPALARRKPLHVWISGPTGSGKTAAARRAVEDIRDGRAITTSRVSGWRHRTFYSVLDAITSDLRILRAEEQRTAARLKKLEKHLGSDPAIILLDDLDLMNPRERADAVYSLAGVASVGLICISVSEKAVRIPQIHRPVT